MTMTPSTAACVISTLSFRGGFVAMLLASVFSIPAQAAPTDAIAAGAAIYKAKCAHCHGVNGEGTEDYPSALTGDKSILELKNVIAKTMPEDTKDKCPAVEAEQIAAFMHQQFYSPIAQDRNRPAVVEFSRLTVGQYQNTVGDLIGSFRWNNPWPAERGLHAEYYNLRSFDKKKLVHDRIDKNVNLQFGEQKPEGYPSDPDMEKRKSDDIHDNAEFSIKWDGSILIPETGEYEFIVESENGIRLYVNDWKKPIFDAWVRSGDEKEYKAKMKLVGGRSYPLSLHFFRYKEKTASVVLKWKRPGHVAEVIPERYLSPKGSPGLFVVTTPFPPDDRSIGYERGTSISKAWQDAVTMAALETSSYVVDQINALAGIKDGMPEEERTKKRDEFCEKFVERAFRRQLSEEEKVAYVKNPRLDVPLETGIKRVVLLALMSPQFLYREAGVGTFDDYSTASWLSYTLWDSMPDNQLFDAARKKELNTPDQIRRQVDRMVSDGRARIKLRDFLCQWLKLDHFAEMSKDQKAFPEFNPEMVSDLKSSLDIELDDFVSNKDADFRQLLLDESLYLNGRLANFYGLDLAADADFQKVTLPNQGRSGVLTHPLLLSGFAYDAESSPIHRGVFLARNILGRRLKPPPEAVSPLAPDLHADMNTRERVILQTSPAACQTCHTMINGLGFPMESFDAVGRYRELEKKRPVDVTGFYLNRDGQDVPFQGSRAMAEFLANSPEVHEAFVEQLFHAMVKQPVRAFGQNRLQELTTGFDKNNDNVQKLMKEIVISTAVKVRELKNVPADGGDKKLSSATN